MKSFSWDIICFGQKEPIKVQFFRLLSALMKVHSIAFLKPQGFIQILNHCWVSWQIPPLYYCSSNLVYFELKEPIKKNFSNFWMVGWKFTKFLMSYLKLQLSFSSNFASLFIVTKDNSSVLFYVKLYMIWTKGTNQSAKFQAFDCSCEISPDLYFERLLLLKVCKISAKKVWQIYVSWNWTVMKNGKKNWFCCFINDNDLVDFDLSTRNSQNFYYDYFFLCKVYNVWPKKVHMSYLSWQWRCRVI